MNNDIAPEESWLKRNWKWSVPLTGLILICLFFVSSIDGNFTDFAQAYSDTSLCQDAIDKANKNDQVVRSLGLLEPVDQFAIMEGNVKYSNNGNTVAVTVRVVGSKGKAKMDISADKVGQAWHYKTIAIRNKIGEEIQILK